MEKCVVEKLISTQSDRVRLCKNSGTSEVWKYFETVEIDGKYAGWGRCVGCQMLLQWNSRNGTSGLKKHRMESCRVVHNKANRTQTLFQMSAVVVVPEARKISPADKFELSNSIVEMCAKDIRLVLHLC